MTATTTTDVLQSGHRSRRLVARAPEHEAIDFALAELASPVRHQDGFWSRLRLVMRGVASKPAGASMITIWVFAVLMLAGTMWIQPHRSVATSLGTAEVSCGVDVFLYGHPDSAVRSACREAASLSLALFIPSVAVLLLGLVGLVGLTLTLRQTSSGAVPSLLDRMRAIPVSLSPLLAGLVAAIFGLFALKPAAITFVQNGAVVTASCGPDALLRRYPDAAIATRCAEAYQDRGVVLIVSIAVVLLVILHLVSQVARSKTVLPRAKARALATVGVVAFSLIALIALMPVPVITGDRNIPTTVSCGLDVYLGGYPDPVVQDACRSAYSSHAAVGLVAGLAVLLSMGAGVRAGARRAGEDDAREAVTEAEVTA